MSKRKAVTRQVEDDMADKILVRWMILIGEIIGLIFGVWIGTWTGIGILALVWILMAIFFTWWDLKKIGTI